MHKRINTVNLSEDMLNRRKFLGNITMAALPFSLGWQALSQNNSQIISTNQFPTIYVDIFIGDIKDDKLSSPLYQNPPSTSTHILLEKIIKKVAKFYDKYGFDTVFQVNKGEMEDSYPDRLQIRDDKRIVVQYTEFDKFRDFFSDKPNSYILAAYGEQWLYDYYNKGNEKIMPFARIIGEEGVRKALENKLKEKFDEDMGDFKHREAEGVALKEKSRAYFFPLSLGLSEEVKSDEEYANIQASTLAHEIGHTLGLDHILLEDNSRNLMAVGGMINKKGINKREIMEPLLNFDARLNKNQIQTIKEYLRSPKPKLVTEIKIN